MIVRSFFVLISGLLYLTNGYCSTEIKPPEGPFFSLLRATFTEKKLNANHFELETTKAKQKVYNFQVPDLGRYQERTPATVPLVHEERGQSNISVFKDIKEQNLSEVNVFEPSALQKQTNNLKELSHSPYSDQFGRTPKITKPSSFDSLPIDNRPFESESSYPSEWAQSNPMLEQKRGQFKRMQSPRGQRFIPNFQQQQAPMMGLPFPNQMPLWPMGNNSNSGYN